MKKTFAEALQDLIDAYLEEYSTFITSPIIYAMEQQCRLLRATSQPTVEPTTKESEKA